MYKVKVTEIGSFVEELLNEKMVVLFGPTAPAELRHLRRSRWNSYRG